jgi:hypothetical protein
MPPPREPDSILPPDGKTFTRGRNSEAASETSRIIARWMDDIIRIPGTNIRIGLDPIIGLFPAVGDLLASSIGLVLVIEGLRHRLPISVLTRMGANVILNNLIGAIPIVGDAFSIWFKSNNRNLALLNRWKSGERTAVRRGSRIFMGVFLTIWATVFIAWLTAWYYFLSFLIGLAP